MALTAEDLLSGYSELTERFDRGDAEALLAELTPVSVPKGDLVIERGKESDSLYLVESGLLSIWILDGTEKLLLGQAGPRTVVGGVGLISPGPASATVSALEPSSLWRLSHAAFERLAEKRVKAASELLHSLSLELVARLRSSSVDLIRRVDDHHWMMERAKRDREGFLRRLATLVLGKR